jgi:hypothetical protein
MDTLVAVFLVSFVSSVPPSPPAEDPDAAFAAEWKAAIQAIPDLARFRPLDLGPAPLDALLSWAGPRGATVYDERCRPIRVERDGRELAGDRVTRVSFEDGYKRVDAEDLRFGRQRAVLGPGHTLYARKAGRWVEAGGGGCGCAEYPSGMLTRVTRNVAWYGSGIVTLRLACASCSETVTPCTDREGERVCRKCRSTWTQSFPVDPAVGVGYPGILTARVRTPPADCSAPCEPDELGTRIENVNRILGKREFLDPDDRGKPGLFRTKEACRKYRGLKAGQ